MIFKKFLNCKKCGLHTTRKNMVFGRGVLNGKILFIGEAPGKTEDLRGKAFVGSAGKLLDRILFDAWELTELSGDMPKYYITNTVACRPTDNIGGSNREPKEHEVLACNPRVMKTYAIMAPYTVVFLGKVAQTYYKKIFPEAERIFHPAYLLRGGGPNHPDYLPTTRALSDILYEHFKK